MDRGEEILRGLNIPGGNFTGVPTEVWFVKIAPVGHIYHDRIYSLALGLEKCIFWRISLSIHGACIHSDRPLII